MNNYIDISLHFSFSEKPIIIVFKIPLENAVCTFGTKEKQRAG